ncbi:MAG: type II toxin-antitoxin system HicA family toxin [Clostridia bacterium]|nr:type II toxin-antitoxin system HicA family toxin [Clostridia bacterium]MBQ8972150.1 type II toxin-antitoxin system HicA family toxin [Clostridia bacterium]
MPMKAREAIRRLKKEGWVEVRQTGSHKQFVKDGKRLTVPDHAGDCYCSAYG